MLFSSLHRLHLSAFLKQFSSLYRGADEAEGAGVFRPLNEQTNPAGFSPGPEGQTIYLLNLVGLKPHAPSVHSCTYSLYAIVRNVLALLLLILPSALHAGGPKFVAGVSWFNPGVLGQPLVWPGGQVTYFVDQGPLNTSINNQQAVAMVDAAAAYWNAVPTAAVTLVDGGQLAEDVSGANVAAANGVLTQPADVTPSATATPIAVIFDADGSVIDALDGQGASDPTSCQFNGVLSWIDNYTPNAALAHGVILLNGRCAATGDQVSMMSFQLERAFGLLLGLDASQVNPSVPAAEQENSELGWPVMQPISGLCGNSGGDCIPAPAALRLDDAAALSRLYPVTAANLSAFPGKQITAAKTISIKGAVTFRNGLGMQGVNVVARPLDAAGNPLYQYTVTAVSGAHFNGNHGNPVTGWTDAAGNRLDMWGSNDPAQQGAFDLSGIPLPPGVAAADYQISFEAINPLYILENSVGPYLDGQPAPSGTLKTITLSGLAAGSTQTLAVNAADSAYATAAGAIGNQSQPRPLSPSGMWSGRLSQVGQSDWFVFPVRGNRIFTIVTQAVDESGQPSEVKALPSIGIWDAFDPPGSAAIGAGPGLNGLATGETWLRVASAGDDLVRVGVSDLRGDGRPDYAYNGWVLYADTVAPARLPASGGAIVIHGMGFRLGDTVQVGGQQAVITSIAPNEITAIAPPAKTGVTGSVDVEVDDLPIFYAAAVDVGGISYDAATGDALTLVTAPMNTVPLGVPLPFSVVALGADQQPAGGVTVLYTVTSGTATLSCGQPACAVTASGDGHATVNLTAVDGTLSIVTASLLNGSSLQAHFAGGTAPAIAALTPPLSLAAGATISWTVEALVQSNGLPLGGQTVSWQASGAGIAAQGLVGTLTNSSGIAAKTLTVGPLTEGQTATMQACLNGTSQCVSFTAFGARPEYGWLQAVSGTAQSLPLSGTPSQIVLRVLDMDGNNLAGAQVSLYQAAYAWQPPCPAHGVCAQAQLLAMQAASATSALDGTVSFAPASIADTATNVYGVAATGNTSTVNIDIEQHP